MSRLASKTAAAAISLSLLIIFRGCMDMAPNHRDFYKGNIELLGEIHGSEPNIRLNYIDLTIDMSKPPSELTRKLGIEISPGKIIALNEIDVNLLSSLAKPDPVPDMMSGEPIAGEAIYRLDGYNIWVAMRKPITLQLGNNAKAVIWDMPRHKRYVMPLSGEDVAELFGAPDRQRDTFQY